MRTTATHTRRQFMARGLTVLGIAIAGTRRAVAARPVKPNRGFTVYRLSLRGRRGSKAALRHCANMRFASRTFAEQNRAHPGDRSQVRAITVSRAEYLRLFVRKGPEGYVFHPIADLRAL